MKVVFDEIDHFHPNFDESVPDQERLSIYHFIHVPEVYPWIPAAHPIPSHAVPHHNSSPPQPVASMSYAARCNWDELCFNRDTTR